MNLAGSIDFESLDRFSYLSGSGESSDKLLLLQYH